MMTYWEKSYGYQTTVAPAAVKINESAHDKTYTKTCVTNTDQNNPLHPPSMSMVLVYPSFDSTEDVEGMLRLVKILIRLHRCAG